MLLPSSLKNGTVFVSGGDPYKVLEYTHTQTGRGGATIRVKSQNLKNGVIKEITYTANEKVEEADIETKSMQYLYSDADFAYFMDMTEYTQVEIPLSVISREKKFLVEEKNFQVCFFEGKPIYIQLPASMYYKVTEAPDAVKGNTSSSATKRITLENGMVVDAPQFIAEGDVVKVNTDSGQYVSRGRSE